MTLSFKNGHHVMVNLDGVDHKAQESLRIFLGVDGRDRMLVLTHRLPVMLNFLDIVVRRQDIDDTEVVEVLPSYILFVRR